jgi:hypothetical protein
MTKNFNARLDKLSKKLNLKDSLPSSEHDKIIDAYLSTLSAKELGEMIESGQELFSIPTTFLDGV